MPMRVREEQMAKSPKRYKTESLVCRFAGEIEDDWRKVANSRRLEAGRMDVKLDRLGVSYPQKQHAV
jgi:hypothetical protein